MDKVAVQCHLLAGIANMDNLISRVVHLAVFHQGPDGIVEYHALAEGMDLEVFKNNIISRYVNAVVVLVIGAENL